MFIVSLRLCCCEKNIDTHHFSKAICHNNSIIIPLLDIVTHFAGYNRDFGELNKDVGELNKGVGELTSGVGVLSKDVSELVVSELTCRRSDQ